MALAYQQPGHFPSEQPARAGDQDPHGFPGRPPASTRDAQRDSRVLSILALCRMSVGCAGTTSTAETLTPAPRAASRTLPARCGAAGPALRAEGTVSTTATTACVPDGPTPTTAAEPTSARRSIACSAPTGVTTAPGAVTMWARRPSTQSRPSASKCPTSPVRCQPGV